jgi:hypothetical protein
VTFGDRPERPRVLSEIARFELRNVVGRPGFGPWDEIDSALSNAMCLLLPSRRRGLRPRGGGSRGQGNAIDCCSRTGHAATSLVTNGANGFIVGSAHPAALGDPIFKVHAAGPH